MSTCEVHDNSHNGVGHILQILKHFFPYAQKQLGFHKPVMISFQSDEDNANKLLGRTAHYNPDDFSITVYVDGRHPKDILRSLSHELIHHTQNCNGDFDFTEELGPGYAQEDGPMRNAELDAYKRGNIIFRDFEDLIKRGAIKVNINFEETGEPKMSLKEWKNKELNQLLMEKWGLAEKRFVSDELDEGPPPSTTIPPPPPTPRVDDEDDDDELEEGSVGSFAKTAGQRTWSPSGGHWERVEDEDDELDERVGMHRGWTPGNHPAGGPTPARGDDDPDAPPRPPSTAFPLLPPPPRVDDEDDELEENVPKPPVQPPDPRVDDEDEVNEQGMPVGPPDLQGGKTGPPPTGGVPRVDDDDKDELDETGPGLGVLTKVPRVDDGDGKGWGKSPEAYTGTRKREKKARRALKRGKGLEERSRTQETITLDEARDLARRIFERITKETK